MTDISSILSDQTGAPAPGDVAMPAATAVSRTRGPLAIIALGIVGFTALAGLVRQRRSEAADLAIALRIQGLKHHSLRPLLSAVSWFGFPPQSRILPPIAIGALWLARLRLEAAMLLLAWGSALLSTTVKLFMQRPRPVAGTDLRVVAANLGGSSFPSGHVLTYVGIYGWLAVVAHVVMQSAPTRRSVTGALVALIAAVGPSRIYLGHHWPTDVAASYLLGSSYLAALVLLYRRLKSRV